MKRCTCSRTNKYR